VADQIDQSFVNVEESIVAMAKSANSEFDNLADNAQQTFVSISDISSQEAQQAAANYENQFAGIAGSLSKLSGVISEANKGADLGKLISELAKTNSALKTVADNSRLAGAGLSDLGRR
jgi:hypothetical protein